MKYTQLVDYADELEEEYDLSECIYFGAIQRLEEVQSDLSKIDEVTHVRMVIRLFLINWGSMNRVVGREGLRWKKLAENLRSLEPEFGKLRGKRFLEINFDDPEVALAIRTIYSKLDPIPYLGSPTTISKILHILNPEIFVMWDNAIVKELRKTNKRIGHSCEGYLEFLKMAQKEIKEALAERQLETGKSMDEIEQAIRFRYRNKTLVKIIDEHNWMKTKHQQNARITR